MIPDKPSKEARDRREAFENAPFLPRWLHEAVGAFSGDNWANAYDIKCAGCGIRVTEKEYRKNRNYPKCETCQGK